MRFTGILTDLLLDLYLKMQKPSVFSSILHRIWRRRDPIEILDNAVKEADIDEVIDILKRYDNEKVIRAALCKSVKANNIWLVHAILQHTKIANSPLFIACKYGNPEIVSLLCGSGFLINVVDESNRTPLLAAVTIRLGTILQPYTQRILDVIPGQQWLWANRRKIMKEIVSLLIEKGADINITESTYRRTPLHQVCVEGTLEIVRNLLDNGANINAKDTHGMTPLFYCLRSNSLNMRLHFDTPDLNLQSYLKNYEEGNKILKYLVERGADINCRDSEDLYILDYAVQTCRPFAAFLLFKYGGMIRWNRCEIKGWSDWIDLIITNLANAHFWRHLVIHTSVCRRIYFDALDLFSVYITYNTIVEAFFLSIKPDTEIPLSLKDQCRICIRSTISTYTEPGLQFEKCVNTLCMPKTLKSFLMFEELEQFVSVRDDLPE